MKRVILKETTQVCYTELNFNADHVAFKHKDNFFTVNPSGKIVNMFSGVTVVPTLKDYLISNVDVFLFESEHELRKWIKEQL